MKILLPFLFILVFICCKSKEKGGLVLYKTEKNVEVTIKSSCKISTVSELKNDSVFKGKIVNASKVSLGKLKIKGSNSIEKSDYRINKTELIITERCGIKTSDGKPSIGLQEIIVLENIQSKQLIEFKKDTIVLNANSLAQPNALVQKKINLDPYIPSLTEKNYKEIKNYLRQKK